MFLLLSPSFLLCHAWGDDGALFSSLFCSPHLPSLTVSPLLFPSLSFQSPPQPAFPSPTSFTSILLSSLSQPCFPIPYRQQLPFPPALHVPSYYLTALLSLSIAFKKWRSDGGGQVWVWREGIEARCGDGLTHLASRSLSPSPIPMPLPPICPQPNLSRFQLTIESLHASTSSNIPSASSLLSARSPTFPTSCNLVSRVHPDLNLNAILCFPVFPRTSLFQPP